MTPSLKSWESRGRKASGEVLAGVDEIAGDVEEVGGVIVYPSSRGSVKTVRIARFTSEDQPQYGVVEGDEIAVVTGDPLFSPIQPTGRRIKLDEVRLLAPVIPRSKVVAVGKNYADHAAEMGGEVPETPLLFFKPNTTVIGPDDPIVLPSWSQEISFEGELAVIIGRICKDVPVERVKEVVLGYTAANDITARDIQREEDQWARAKGFDTSCPLGPWIDTTFDPENAPITTRVNGEVHQDGNTADMLRKVPELISYISSAFTLLPGDVILTGTPAGVGPLQHGDRVEVEIGELGTLTNPVLRR